MEKVKFLIGTLSNGGAERVVSNLSLNLNSDVSIEILLFGKYSRVEYPYYGELIHLDKSQHNNLLDKIKAFFLRIKKLKSIKELEPDATIISFLEYPNLINSLTSKDGTSIISVRNHMSTKHKKGLKAKLWNLSIKYIYPKSNMIISVSEEIKRDLVENYQINENKIKVIYNSYDIEAIKKSSAADIEDEYKHIFTEPVIITSGRLNKQKGQWHLIRAFSLVKKQVPNAKLVILGEGNLKEYLQQLSKDLGCCQDIYFFGFKKNPFKYIARSKVFILSSLYEGFPNALAEAMACEIPVISSDCLSGPREILTTKKYDKREIDYGINFDRYGVLVPVCDGRMYTYKDPITTEENLMADSIISILRDEKLWGHFSRQSSKRIQDFHINNIIKEWENLLIKK